MNAVKLYFRFLITSLRVQTRYPASFLLYSCANFLTNILQFVGMWALFHRFHVLGQWSLAEVMLFYGMTHMAFALAEAGMRGFDTIERHIRTGEFDRILLRPRTAFLQVLGSEFQLLRVGGFVNGLIPFAVGAAMLRPGWNAAQWLLIVLSVLGGSMTYAGLILIRAMASFFTVESLEVFNIFTYGGVEASAYPMDIYAEGLRKLFTFAVPLAAINYFPLSLLLGKSAMPGWVSFLSPMAGAAFFTIGIFCWRFGVRHYRSTGS